MGLGTSRPRSSARNRPSRHAWGRIQDVSYEEPEEEPEEEILDRRVVDERADWPRSCPVLHLDIQNDFPLDKQRSLVRSCYRFWLFSWWVSVINFVAVMASLLTSNVTNSGTMVTSFVFSIVYLFAVFFLYFRALYWALRLESNVLFIWFYIMSLVLLAYFAYVIAESIGLVSILAQPLAPGSQLPVKVNPILPVVLFTLVIVFYILCIVMTIYYFSSAFFWQRISDRDKLKMYRKQRKKRWLSSWFGGKSNQADDDDDFDDDSGEKPKYVFECTLFYEKLEDDYLDDVGPDGTKLDEKAMKKKAKEREKKLKNRKKGQSKRDLIPIAGKVALFPEGRKVTFHSDEAIFNSILKFTLMMIHLYNVEKRDDMVLLVQVKLDQETVLEEDLKAFHDVPGSCSLEAGTVRFFEFEFRTKEARDKCFKEVKKIWAKVQKKKQVYEKADEMTMVNDRINLFRKNRQRAEEHLLTHKDWKLLVSYVWRKTYKAGEVIVEKGSQFNDILHITDGVVAVYLETSEEAKRNKKQQGADFDLQGALFPMMDTKVSRPAPSLADMERERRERQLYEGQGAASTRPTYFTVTFEQRKLGFSYSKTKRAYNLAAFDDPRVVQSQVNVNSVSRTKSTFKNNYAAIIHSVKPGSEAARLGLQVGDELVKIGRFDVEQNECTQRGITSLIRSAAYPLTLEFRRPPQKEFEVDEAGFVAPDPVMASEELREKVVQAEGGPEYQMDYYEPQAALGDEPSISLNYDRSSANNPASPGYTSYKREGGYETESSIDEEDDEDEYLGKNKNGRIDSFGFGGDGDSHGQPPVYDLMMFGSEDEDDRRRTKQQKNKGTSFEMSRLDLVEQYAGNVAERRQSFDMDDERLEFHPSAAPERGSSDETAYSVLEPRTLADFDPAVRRRLGSYDLERQALEAQEKQRQQSMAARLLSKGRRYLFGSPFVYNKVVEAEVHNKIGPTVPLDEYAVDDDTINQDHDDDRISIIVEKDDRSSNSSSSGSDDDDTDDEDHVAGEEFEAIPTYEAVGKFERGDSLGIIPWILNQPVSMVQLVAESDVTIHSIMLSDLTKLFKKNGHLALAFYKYVAAVIGERADRDEEFLCEQLSKTIEANKRTGRDTRWTRLLDEKPIKAVQNTKYEERIRQTEEARGWFEQDFDMAFDCIIFDTSCKFRILGNIDNSLVGYTWHGVDSKNTKAYNTIQGGVLYVTHHYVCFRSIKKGIEFQRKPRLYGKVHINDIYNVRRYGDNGASLIISTDDLELDAQFEDAATALLVSDWIKALIESGSTVQKAPHSYTLPGDLYGFSSNDATSSGNPSDLHLPSVANEPLNMLYRQQRSLRTEFLVLTQTLQQVLTNEDRYIMFRDGRSVTFFKGQNIVAPARVASSSANTDSDPEANRRPATGTRFMEADGPNGLYLVGEGELVVQREVNGNRIQFASYKAGTVFGVERFLTGAPSPFAVKVTSKTAVIKFAPRDKVMAILRSNLPLAARFYQYCALLLMQRLRGAILSRPIHEDEQEQIVKSGRGSKGCSIL